MSSPVLDRRTFADVFQQLLDEARRRAPDWNPDAPGDVGRVLAVIYAHYVELALARLNLVPDKQKLAFLDLMGVGLLPAGVARTPIVFTPGPTAGPSTRVERGTQVATAQTETDPAVTFETELALNVVAAALANALTIEPKRDRYADRSAVVRGEDEFTFDPFRGDRRLAHEIYLGLPADQPFLDAVEGRLIVEFDVDPETTKPLAKSLDWSVHRGDWLALADPREETLGRLVFESAHGPGEPIELAGDGLARPLARRWLRATADLAGGGAFPWVDRVGLLAQLRYRPDDGVAQILGDGQNGFRVDFDSSFEPFAGEGTQLWLASAREFGPERPRGHVRFDIKDESLTLPQDWTRYELVWSYFDGTDWLILGSAAIENTDERSPMPIVSPGFTDTTDGLQRTGWISFPRPSDFEEGDPGVGSTNRWIRAEPSISGADNSRSLETPPTVTAIRTSRDLPAQGAVVGTAPVDPTAPFQPFGAFPQRNTLVYLASKEALSQRGAEVTIFLTFSPSGQPNPGSIEEALRLGGGGIFRLAWEYHGATGWQPLGETTVSFGGTFLAAMRAFDDSFGGLDLSIRDISSSGIVDTTQGFRRNGEVSFVVPADMTEVDVGGLVSHWVRVRIADGDYGRPPEFILRPKSRARDEDGEEGDVQPDEENQIVPKPNTGNLAPPTIESVAFAYEYSTALRPTLVTRNAFTFADRTGENGRKEGLDVPVLLHAAEDGHPTFYLGFDRELPNDAVNLFFAVPPRQLVERIAPRVATTTGSDEGGTGNRLRWEYWDGTAWTRLFVVDDTHDLTEPGIVQFLGPVDFAPRVLFGQPLRHWIRIVLANPDEDYVARLNGVFVNGVEAVQARTIAREVIGSSSGGADQRIRAASPPVLPGQELWVREPELPPAEELRRIEADEGPNAVDRRAGEIWIRWHEVRSFVRSGPHDRHYSIERIGGEFVFGNGRRGVIPPAGADNIAVDYRSGGTDRGNRPAGSVSQLKTSIPVIASVTNPIPASGGSVAETLTGVLERGPQTLKHRGRAITPEDYEWLARQASGTSVARARCIPTTGPELEFEPGWVTLIIVPSGREKKLLPSAELVRVVTRYLEQRVPAALVSESPAHLNVIGPGYIPVEFAIELNPVSFTEADAVRQRALGAVDNFLHPLTGGPDGIGWEFGRDVYLSEVFAVLEQVPGVEHVHSLRFKPTAATLPLRVIAAPPAPLVRYARLTSQTAAGEVTVRVVENVLAGGHEVMLTHFREGERIGLWPDKDTTRDPTVELTIHDISGDVLTVDAFRAAVEHTVGTIVASLDGASSSFLVAAAAAGERVETLRVQRFVPTWAIFRAERLRIPDLHLPYSGRHTIVASQN